MRARIQTLNVCLILLGVLQVTGIWTEWMSRLQTSFGGWQLPL